MGITRTFEHCLKILSVAIRTCVQRSFSCDLKLLYFHVASPTGTLVVHQARPGRCDSRRLLDKVLL